MNTERNVLTTDVDDFIDLVKKTGKMTISDAAKKLGVMESTVEAWTDFLVEERILGIEYRFTTPYIFMDMPVQEKAVQDLVGLETRESFLQKAEKRKIPHYQALILWVKYLSLNKEKIKAVFLQKANSRGIEPQKALELWKKYYESLRSG